MNNLIVGQGTTKSLGSYPAVQVILCLSTPALKIAVSHSVSVVRVVIIVHALL